MDCGVDMSDPKVAAVDQHLALPQPFRCRPGGSELPPLPRQSSPARAHSCLHGPYGLPRA